MEHEILLSICIPTYNRADSLDQCLKNIVCQFEDKSIKNRVEVIVSDNASPDNTQEVVKNYQRIFDNITYTKNPENVGFDKNFMGSVASAKGTYCWSIGDDDFMQHGALKFILEILSKKELALLTVNFHPFVDMQKSLREETYSMDNALEYSTSPEEFYAKGYCQGILGIFIFNRLLWLAIDKTQYEKYWSYHEIILKMMGTSSLPFAYLKTPVLFMGQDYRWNKDEKGTSLFVLVYSKKFIERLNDYGWRKEFIDAEKRRMANNLPMTVASAKTYNLEYSYANLSLMYREFKNYPLPLLLATAIFLMPNPILKIAKHIKKILT